MATSKNPKLQLGGELTHHISFGHFTDSTFGHRVILFLTLSKKIPEDEEIIFTPTEDYRSMNLGFKEKRKAMTDFIFSDPFAELVFSKTEARRRHFKNMNLLRLVKIRK